jgi:uncharacterized protein (TIGR03435 family)
MIAMTERAACLARTIFLIAAAWMVVSAPAAFGQASAAADAAKASSKDADAKPLAFDVVSVKRSEPNGRVRIRILPDGWSASGIPLKGLISNAYGVRQDLISGAPGWTESTAYDIEAKEDPSVAAALQKLPNDQRAAQINSMLQAVLADRFHLKVTRVDKELPAYELVIAKGGFKLKEADPNKSYSGGLKGPDGVARAGMMMTGQGQVIGQGIPMSRLATNLSYQVGRSVLDKTGLTGNYDLTLKWTPDQAAGTASPGADSDASGPSIFTALEEQLGLKLESRKAPTETLVIDQIERPSEN